MKRSTLKAVAVLVALHFPTVLTGIVDVGGQTKRPAAEKPKFVAQWGGFGKEEGKFQYPQKVTISPENFLVVADAGNSRIQIFDLSGKFVRAFGTPGYAEGQFFNPGGIAMDPDGNFYVADFQERRFQKFDANGKFIRAIPASAAAVVCGRALFAVEKTEHTVRKLTLDLDKTITTFGGYGNEPARMQFPSGIGCSGKTVMVADMVGERIQVFDLEGKFLRTFGIFGSKSGQFHNPYDVTADSEGNLYVVDMSNHRVQVFTETGKFLTSFGSFGTESGQFRYPTGIAVDKEGFVYVVDGGNHRVQKFSPLRGPHST